MARDRIDSLDEVFDDHPSLSASLEDFEHENRSPLLELPSQHSGFKSDESEADADSNSEGPWSPPWNRQNPAGGWYRHQPYPPENRNLKAVVNASHSCSRSREASSPYESAREDDGDITIPANIPLPRGSLSPTKERSPSPSPAYRDRTSELVAEKTDETSPLPGDSSNCMQIRQHHTFGNIY